MKRLISILLFLLVGLSAFSQAVTQTGFVGKFTFQSFSAGGSSDVTGTLDAFSDQTNQYFANNIQVGDVIWDNQGNRWEVMAVNSSNLLQADVDLRNVNSVGGTPVGVGFVSRETSNMGLSLFVPDNNIGISQQLKSRIESHNMLLIDQYVSANQDSVFTGATAADTTTVSDPTIGDVLVADNGDVAYYDGDGWVVSGGDPADGNGIYTGSGNVPDGTEAYVDDSFIVRHSADDHGILGFYKQGVYLATNNDDGQYTGISFNHQSATTIWDTQSQDGNFYNYIWQTSNNSTSGNRIEFNLERYGGSSTYNGISLNHTRFEYATPTSHSFRIGNYSTGIERVLINEDLVHLGDITNELTRAKIDVENGVINFNAQNGFTATTVSGIMGFTHTGSTGQLIVQSQDERATFQGEDTRINGDTIITLNAAAGVAEMIIKDNSIQLPDLPDDNSPVKYLGVTAGRLIVESDAPGGGGDDWGSQVVISDATLTGLGTAGSPLSVANPAAVVIASNGLSDDDGSSNVDVELGGTLSKNTTIDGSTGTHDLNIVNMDDITLEGEDQLSAYGRNFTQVGVNTAITNLAGDSVYIQPVNFLSISSPDSMYVSTNHLYLNADISGRIGNDAGAAAQGAEITWDNNEIRLTNYDPGSPPTISTQLAILNDYFVLTGVQNYADDTAADADGSLPSGAVYTVTGDRSLRIKP